MCLRTANCVTWATYTRATGNRMPALDNITSVTLDSILEVVRNPTSNLTAAMLVGSALIVLLLILVLLAWIFLLSTEEREPGQSDSERTSGQHEGRRRRGPWLPILLLVVSFGLILVGGARSGEDQRCLQCHQTSAPPASVEQAHASCVACHERGGVLYLPARAARRLRMEIAGLRGDPPGEGLGARAANAGCLECHDMTDVDEGLLASVETSGSVGILMSHKEPLDAGMHCVDCHGSVNAHVSVTDAGGHPTMNDCIDCHDGTRASVDCHVCHYADPVQAVRVESIPVSKTRLGKPTDCSGCHSVETCDACHGIRLPHSENFVKGAHASQAAFNGRKKNCQGCHTTKWCIDSCHPNGKMNTTWGHPSDWATSHARASEDTCRGCHSAGFDCMYCHL